MSTPKYQSIRFAQIELSKNKTLGRKFWSSLSTGVSSEHGNSSVLGNAFLRSGESITVVSVALNFLIITSRKGAKTLRKPLRLCASA